MYKSVRIGCESTIALVKIRSTWKTLKAIEQLEFSYTAGESVKQFNCSE